MQDLVCLLALNGESSAAEPSNASKIPVNEGDILKCHPDSSHSLGRWMCYPASAVHLSRQREAKMLLVVGRGERLSYPNMFSATRTFICSIALYACITGLTQTHPVRSAGIEKARASSVHERVAKLLNSSRDRLDASFQG